MNYIQILVLAVLQGACELLPVSSSAHVIMAEKLMGIDPSSPEMTLLLVMLHTGTMLAVIAYFWRSWKESFFGSAAQFKSFAISAAIATALTLIVGMALKLLIEKVYLKNVPNAEVELIFGNLALIGVSLATVGVLIIVSGSRQSTRGRNRYALPPSADDSPPVVSSACIGLVQGLCLPFRGFSRSGATISTGLLLGISKRKVEEFSFALVVILTPLVIGREVHRLLAHRAALVQAEGAGSLFHLFLPSAIGMVAAFLAGLLALKWLSDWLEKGRWQFFGWYCLAASALAFTLYRLGM